MGFFDFLTALFVRDTAKAVTQAKKDYAAEQQKRARDQAARNVEYAIAHDKCYSENNQIADIFLKLISLDTSMPPKLMLNCGYFIKALSAYPYYLVRREEDVTIDERQINFLKAMPATDIRFSGSEILEAHENTVHKNNCRLALENFVGLTSHDVGCLWYALFSMPAKDSAKKDKLLRMLIDRIVGTIEAFIDLEDIRFEQGKAILGGDIRRTFEAEYAVADEDDYESDINFVNAVLAELAKQDSSIII